MAAHGPIFRNPLTRISKIINELAPIFSSDDGIHTHTRNIGSACKSLLDLEEGIIPTTSLDQIISEITEYSKNDKDIITVLNNIKFQGEVFDDETGLNIAKQLISVWQLSKTVDYPNAKDLVIDNLKHNISANGGCLAGISARLVHPYLCFLQEYFLQNFDMEQEFEFENTPPITNQYQYDLEKNFAGSPQVENDFLSDDERLSIAIALSLG